MPSQENRSVLRELNKYAQHPDLPGPIRKQKMGRCLQLRDQVFLRRRKWEEVRDEKRRMRVPAQKS